MNSADFASAIRAAGLKGLNSEALSQLEAYLALLLKWNSRLNLTSIREPKVILQRHFIECIQCARSLPEAPTLLDFGSGAGLPGIPIAVCRPEIHVTLGESQRKKAAFLREVVRTLALNADVFDGRVEKMPPERQYSIVTLRAVDKMSEACHAAFERIAPKGWIALFATIATETALKDLLPGIEWKREIPTCNLDNATILIGQRI